MLSVQIALHGRVNEAFGLETRVARGEIVDAFTHLPAPRSPSWLVATSASMTTR